MTTTRETTRKYKVIATYRGWAVVQTNHGGYLDGDSWEVATYPTRARARKAAAHLRTVRSGKAMVDDDF